MQTIKSFLVLFFKKELLALFPLSRGPRPGGAGSNRRPGTMHPDTALCSGRPAAAQAAGAATPILPPYWQAECQIGVLRWTRIESTAH